MIKSYNGKKQNGKLFFSILDMKGQPSQSQTKQEAVCREGKRNAILYFAKTYAPTCSAYFRAVIASHNKLMDAYHRLIHSRPHINWPYINLHSYNRLMHNFYPAPKGCQIAISIRMQNITSQCMWMISAISV